MSNNRNKLDTLRPRLVMIVLGIFFLLCVAVGVGFYHLVEKMSLIDSFYLTSVTLTTVGYGDVAPRTDLGKIFTSLFSFVGVATFLGFASALFRSAVSRVHRWPHGNKWR